MRAGRSQALDTLQNFVSGVLWLCATICSGAVVWHLGHSFSLIFHHLRIYHRHLRHRQVSFQPELARTDRKSTRLNSSHVAISYAVFCLKKKKTHIERQLPPNLHEDTSHSGYLTG